MVLNFATACGLVGRPPSRLCHVRCLSDSGAAAQALPRPRLPRSRRSSRTQCLRRVNITVPVSEAGRIQVVCHGLTRWHGAQLAVDAKLVSPLTRDGSPLPAADAQPRVSLARGAAQAAAHISGAAAAALSSSAWKQVGVGVRKPRHSFDLLSHKPAQLAPLEWHPLGCRAANLRHFAP